MARPLFHFPAVDFAMLMLRFQRFGPLRPDARGRLLNVQVLQISRTVYALLTHSSIFPPHEGTILLLDASCCGSCAENYRMGGNKSAGWVSMVMLYNHHIHEPQMAL